MLFLLTACSLNKMTGDMMTDYTKDHLTPYILQSSDLEMACEMGVSMGPYLLSFERVTKSPDEVAIATIMTSAVCAEQRAWEEELRHLRALFQKNINEAKDARVAQQRAHALTASRYYQSYQRFEKVFAEDRKPETDEELSFLMGLLAGVQAVQHDRASSISVGVPTDIPVNIARKAQYLDNEKWFGIPKAIEAAVWLVIPGTAPADMEKDQQQPILELLQKSAQIGNQKGLRLAGSIFAVAAYNKGRLDLVKKIITDHSKSLTEVKAVPQYQMLDTTATAQLQALSDKLWTEQTGSRTPHQGLGTFFTEIPKENQESNELLDGI